MVTPPRRPPDNRAERRRRAAREMRHLLERVIERSPWRTQDPECDRCTFCGATVEYSVGRPERDRSHRPHCLWLEVTSYLRDHPQS